MNWGKIALAGLLGGIAGWIADFIMHGAILGNTYMSYPDVFTQEQSNPAYFLLNSVLVGFFAATLFSKTRDSWAAGLMGGVTFGALLGMVAFWTPFYSPLVLDGFPYFLAWCQGGAALISAIVIGAVLGLVIKRA